MSIIEEYEDLLRSKNELIECYSKEIAGLKALSVEQEILINSQDNRIGLLKMQIMSLTTNQTINNRL